MTDEERRANVEAIVRELKAKKDYGKRPQDIQDILNWALQLKEGPIYREAWQLDQDTSRWDYQGDPEYAVRAFAERHRAAYEASLNHNDTTP